MQELMPRRLARESFEPDQSGTRVRIGNPEGTRNKQYNNFVVIISFFIGACQGIRNWLWNTKRGDKFCETCPGLCQ